jgi:hypothetical protein
MKSTNIMTLFSEEPRPGTGPSSFLISALLHGVVFILLLIGLRHAPRMNDHSVADRYSVRLLRPPRIEPPPRRTIKGSTAQSAAQSVAQDLAGGGGPPALSVPYPLPQLPPRTQVLVQPDAPPDQLLPQQIPIPLAVLWSPENSPSKVIVAPPQQEPTVAQTRPALIKPNREPKLADLNITMTPFPARTPIIPPGTTTPIAVRGTTQVQLIPSTSSAQLEPPSPARVLSISPLQADGPVFVPLANQPPSGSGELVISQSTEKNSGNGNGNPASKASGTGAGDGPGSTKGTGVAGSGTVGQNGAGTGGNGAATGGDAGAMAGPGVGYQPSVIHITLPKDGQFGIVVVGSSVIEQYPEIAGIWSGRLVYTVYLHVGTGKNWILQYSVPRTEEASAAGNVTRPEAPWPYDILRPHLAPEDYNSDTLMVHGFVNLAGRFERLAMVFPTGFTQAKFVLDALQRWQFRPARQNGQIAAVEVLLIIPEETE